ncbi:MAG: hypothetical protein ACLPL5_12530 [Stellaceae bacterium]
MDADTQAQVAFFLTGRRPGEHLDAVDGLGLRPALFAGYRELSRLRYDFPLVLVPGRADGQFAQSLSGLVDNTLKTAAQGADAERIRNHALRLEQEIRVLVAEGATGSLSVLWDKAAAKLTKGADKSFADSLKRVRAAIKFDGEVGLRRGLARAAAAPCLERGAEAESRGVPRQSRPAGAETVGHFQGL